MTPRNRNPVESWKIEQRYDNAAATRAERIEASERQHAGYSDPPRPLCEHWWQFWRKPKLD